MNTDMQAEYIVFEGDEIEIKERFLREEYCKCYRYDVEDFLRNFIFKG